MEKQTSLSSIEHTEKGHGERGLEPIESKVLDGNEEIREAREALLGKDELYKEFFQAVKDRESMDSSGFAYIENLFIDYCQNLSDSDIESIIRQFNRGLNDYASTHAGVLSAKHREPENIHLRQIGARGIISVVNFIKSRRKLLETEPPTDYGFYVEDILDSKYKIDLIECIFTDSPDGPVIDTMNLIQVKSSDPTEREIQEIQSGHKAWIDSSVMDLESFRREYTEGMPEGIPLEILAKNPKEIAAILEDVFTDPKNLNAEDFIQRLGLQNLNNKQKAWLLSEYGAIVRKVVLECRDQGIVPTDEADQIIEQIDKMETTLRSKTKLPKKIMRVRNINSIVTVGERIVEEIKLKSQSSNPDFDKIMKYN